MSTRMKEEDKCIWGEVSNDDNEIMRKTKTIEKLDIIIQSHWGLNDRPTLNNVHPKDKIEICEYCGERVGSSECTCYCPHCDELLDDGWCPHCEEAPYE